MTIHNATQEKAKKNGIILSETDDAYKAYWPERNRFLIGDNPPQLLKNMLALKDMTLNYRSFSMEFTDGAYVVTTKHPDFKISSQHLDYAYEQAKKEWQAARAEMEDEELEELDAEEKAEEDAEEEKTGSVVKPVYRARYKEGGHPTNCGDELAFFLKDYCKSTEAQSLAIFEHVCELNGVNLAKYNRTTHGWQGRLRMTGRNILSRVVFEAGGKLILQNDEVHQMSGEWMANQRFKREKQPEVVAEAQPAAAE
jgi:hypothetical protein